MLKDEHEHAVGRPHREQVERDRLERHDDRPERDEQEQEREGEHEDDHEGDPMLHLVREVDVFRGRSGDSGLDAGIRPKV